MTTVLLLRHGRTAANADGILAGWTPGIGLDQTGQTQVAALATRLEQIPLAAVVSSPLQRCRETAAAVLAGRRIDLTIDEQIGECHYGAWTGRPLKELAKEDLWKQVQGQPSTASFPPSDQYRHESMAQMQYRALEAVRAHDQRLTDEIGSHAVWALVSHGDVIKSILADSFGQHLDQFQRISVGPASLSAIRLTPQRTFVLRTNDTGSDPSDLVPTPETADTSDAAVGGGSSTAG